MIVVSCRLYCGVSSSIGFCRIDRILSSCLVFHFEFDVSDKKTAPFCLREQRAAPPAGVSFDFFPPISFRFSFFILSNHSDRIFILLFFPNIIESFVESYLTFYRLLIPFFMFGFGSVDGNDEQLFRPALEQR